MELHNISIHLVLICLKDLVFYPIAWCLHACKFGWGWCFCCSWLYNFTLLNKAFVLVKASIPTHTEVRLRFIREAPLAGEQRLRFVFTLKTEIIF